MCAEFSRSIRMFHNFTIEMIGNKTGLLLKCVDLRWCWIASSAGASYFFGI